MLLPDKLIDDRYLTQDDRIAIAEGLLAGRTPGPISQEIGKHRSTVYRELRPPDIGFTAAANTTVATAVACTARARRTPFPPRSGSRGLPGVV